MSSGEAFRFATHSRVPARPSSEFGQFLDRFTAGADEAMRVIRQWPGYDKTPLIELTDIASDLGVDRLFYKDEGPRFGLGSFKALGGAYAVYSIIRNALGLEASAAPCDFRSDSFRQVASKLTVASATAGNHGRSVAWGAKMFGCQAVIFIHEGVGPERARAIEQYGAKIVKVKGDYDESVREAARQAERHRWTIVSDTSYPGYTDIPSRVMQGYSLLFSEIDSMLDRTECPTHVILQGGVGGLAGAGAAYYAGRYGAGRPRIIVVEPDSAACLFESSAAGQITKVEGELNTFLLGMACGEPSIVAWEILDQTGDAFLTIPDSAALSAMQLLNRECAVIAGECAGAGLAALKWICTSREIAASLEIDAKARVLLIGTEGATDPVAFERLLAMQL